MRLRILTSLLVPVLLVAYAVAALAAQGIQTGTIKGSVRDQQNLPVPGVAVTVTSPALLGVRSTSTDSRGQYVLRILPVGDYVVTFSLAGFGKTVRTVTIPLGLTLEEHVLLVPRAQEAVIVTAEVPPPLTTPVVGVNFTRAQIDALPMQRTLSAIAELSPGLTNITPNTDQVSISGAFAFDNSFLLNGVDIGDGVIGRPRNLFIEDAIQEVQTLTSGVSAEYGHFSGGVVSAVTRSGGNLFSGGLRVNLSNPAWSALTPFEQSHGLTHASDVSPSVEGTFGGPLIKDRLWFFGAGRWENLSIAQPLPVTGIANTETDRSRRGEFKLTGVVAPGHSIQAGYVNNYLVQANIPSPPGATIDPTGIVRGEFPNWFSFANYRGALRNRLLVEAQFSERRWSKKAGGTSRALTDSPFVALSQPDFYNAPFFDANAPEGRNNRQFSASVLAVADWAGRHDVKTGYEWYRSQWTGGNSQTATDYVFNADYKTDVDGNPVYDSGGRLIPLFQPGVTYLDHYLARRDGVQDIDTQSLYVQDRWALNSRWSFDLGARFEAVRSRATGVDVGIDAKTLVPRLAAAYDVNGDGKYVVHTTYGHYAGRYNDRQVANVSNVGNPDIFTQTYIGPPGEGRAFVPGFDLANYGAPLNGFFPTANVRMASDLSSPITKEFTSSFGVELGGKGYAQATYVFRRTSDLVEDEIALANGTTDVVRFGADLGTLTNVLFKNSSVATRQYQGLLFVGRYRLSRNWSIDGHYTAMLQNDGNYEGEAPNNPGAVSQIGDYPEAFTAARHYPSGRLQNFQRHKLRIWSTYSMPFGRSGNVSLSGLWRVNSAQVYSLKALAPLTTTQLALLAAYPDPPVNQTLFFAGRGSEEFKGYGLFDASLSVSVPAWGTVRPFVKVDVFNVFNNLKQIAWNTTVKPDPASPKDSLGLPTGYILGSAFGTATSNASYPAPYPGGSGGRTFQAAIGFRF